MKIELHKIKIKDLVKGYINNEEDGVIGYDNKLNIRPKFQREFVYDEKQRNEVIYTIFKNFPLNIMYWCKNQDDTFELLDGQQRTISICEFVDNSYSIKINKYDKTFENLTQNQKENILNYELMVYICEGNEEEKLEWFKTINIAGEKLFEQELRNAMYTGLWLTDAKKYFSKTSCPAYNIAKDYMKGSPLRQDYLETVLKWISNKKIEIDKYMSIHQKDPNANELWLYFNSVINWTKTTFRKYRKEMKGIDWGYLYNQYKDIPQNSEELEEKIKKLMIDDDVTNKKGIYEYLLSNDEKFLNIRTFNENEKRQTYEKQKGICPICEKHFEIEEMEADHITPWVEGGKTNISNCQMLCRECNRRKSNK